MFAGDCVLYYSDVNWPRIYNPLQERLDRSVIWSKENRLLLNVNKAKAMVIGNKGTFNVGNRHIILYSTATQNYWQKIVLAIPTCMGFNVC